MLRDRMYEDLKLRGYRPKTITEYVRWGRRFAAYHIRSPQEMGEPEVRAFLMHQLEEEKVRPASRKMRGGCAAVPVWGDAVAAGGGGADSVAQDAGRGLIHIRDGKGGRDRYVMLSSLERIKRESPSPSLQSRWLRMQSEAQGPSPEPVRVQPEVADIEFLTATS